MNGLPAAKFVGVYSGRLATNDPLDAQLGLVWPASSINDIVSGQSLDGAFAPDLRRGPPDDLRTAVRIAWMKDRKDPSRP